MLCDHSIYPFFPQIQNLDLDDFVEAAFMFYGKQNMLDNTPITLSLEKNNDPRLLKSPLKFPGKLAIDALNNRLFISDSNHNRLGSALPHPLVPSWFACP